MSLLTEKQLDEIIEVIRDAVNVEFPHTLRGEIHEWNKKQTGVQVRLNWDRAPKEATAADIKVLWRGIEQSWALEAVFASIPRPITPHPHAEIIAKYAEVAARRCDPWAEFENRPEGGFWVSCTYHLRFNENVEYRHIGDKPDPMTARKGDDKPWNLSRDD